jgi:hypothetical protein
VLVYVLRNICRQAAGKEGNKLHRKDDRGKLAQAIDKLQRSLIKTSMVCCYLYIYIERERERRYDKQIRGNLCVRITRIHSHILLLCIGMQFLRRVCYFCVFNLPLHLDFQALELTLLS